MNHLIVKQFTGAPNNLPSIAENASAAYTAGQVVSQSLRLTAAGNPGSQYVSPLGFSQITVTPSAAVTLTASKGSNPTYINQTVNQLTTIDDTADSFTITNHGTSNVTVQVSFVVSAGTVPSAGVVTSVNGQTGDITITAQNLPGLSAVAYSGSYTDLTNRPSLATVATSGNYNDLINLPTIPAAQVNSDWNATTGLARILNKPTLASVATSGLYTDLSGRPTLATVATTGAYGDLSGKPTLSAVATSGSYTDLLNKPTFATVATSGLYSDLTGTPVLAPVATSGRYTDLTNTPALATVATSGNYADLLNRPTFATVATSGSYSDLVDKPTYAVVAITGSYTDLLNKPTFATVATSGSYTDLINKPALATVALSGNYNDLSNKPSAYTLPIATYSALGGVMIGQGLTINTGNGLVSLSPATTNAIGGIKPGTGLAVAGDGTLSLTGLATVATTGSYTDLLNKPVLATVATTGNYNDLSNKYALPIASSSVLGGIKIGSGLTIAGDGTVTASGMSRAVINLGNLTSSQVSNTNLATVGFINQTQVVFLLKVDTGSTDQYTVQIIETVSSVDTVIYQTSLTTGPMKDAQPFTIDRSAVNSTLTLRVTAGSTGTSGTIVTLVSQGV